MADLRDHLQTALGAKYSIERELVGGAMSRVFVAEENSLGRRVVVKVLPADILSGVSLERFKREIAIAARLNHPHIVPLLAADEIDGVPYYTMPFIEGETLRARLTRLGELPAADAVRILRQVASALAFAHAKGVVHRDIKPENILLIGEHALVADFGVSKALNLATQGQTTGLTSVGIAVGTPAYMAPEQAAADPATDHRADVYAFGVIAYEMLTSQTPFAGRPAQALIAAHIIETPKPIGQLRPAVPLSLAALVMRCLEKQPADRPHSADDIVRQLDSMRMSSPLMPRERPSVAVLPLVNLSGDAEDEHFSDGLTDELIGALGQLEELAVSGRTSVFALKGKGLDVRAIAERLGVTNVLEGSVRHAGNRLKVRVQLVNADGLVLWSQAYDRTIADVFAVQEEIAQSVVGALEIRLGGSRGPLIRPPTADLAAYDLYLRGRFVRRRFNPDDLRRAIGYFEQAVARDPMFARAHAALADVHALLAVFASQPTMEVLPVARAYARKAVELDDALADGHWALGHVAFALELDLPSAGREFERAIALDPGHVDARHMYGIWLLDLGRFDDAVAELTRALASDPLLAEASMTLGDAFVAMGQAQRGIPHLLEALELSPGFTYARERLADAYLQVGRYADGIVECERAAAGGGARETAALAYAYAAAGRSSEARATLAALVRSEGYLPPNHIAMAYAALGDPDASFSWLERAFAEHDPHVMGLTRLPAFQSLRSLPRFAALARRMGLMS
jgi:serine/threonine-protein kinase